MSIEIIKKQDFNVQVIRTGRRKTTCIQINNGQVIIRVPKKLSVDKIDVLIDSRTRWIKQKLLQQQQLPPLKYKQYVNGEEVYYLGRRYQLKVLIAAKQTVKLSHGYLHVQINKKEPAAIRTALKKWYLEHARQQLESRVKQFSKMMQVFPVSIQVREYKARWGSCSSKGHIKFNWKLIMAASDVVDYVVVHELCHLIEHNHSANFWTLVKTILPDYEIQRQWLRQQGHSLEL
ncbi:MAG: M48 family metallopeptidase [Methylophagaceae bacterium]